MSILRSNKAVLDTGPGRGPNIRTTAPGPCCTPPSQLPLSLFPPPKNTLLFSLRKIPETQTHTSTRAHTGHSWPSPWKLPPTEAQC